MIFGAERSAELTAGANKTEDEYADITFVCGLDRHFYGVSVWRRVGYVFSS
jgi:hypothetical protein